MGQAAPTNLAPILIAGVLFLVAIIALSLWASGVRRQRTGSRQEALFALGFTPLDPPPDELRERVAALQPHRSQIMLRCVFGRPSTSGHAYLFDSIDAENDDASFMTSGVLAIASKALRSPAFTVLPRPEARGSGSLGSLMDGMLELTYALLANRGLVRVPVPDDPEFEQRFVVLAAEPWVTEVFLTPGRRTALLALSQGLVAAACQDTLMLSAHTPSGGSQPTVDEIGSRLELLEKLFEAMVAG